jgi:hypothetical protein
VELSFCGEGTNDGGGAILNKVSLKEYWTIHFIDTNLNLPFNLIF